MGKDNKYENQSEPSIGDFIPLSKASEISGFTVRHLALLIRQEELWGEKMGGPNWFTTEKAVRNYVARNRKPGPKRKTKVNPI